MRVLLVSAYPFSHSSRGMDVLTQAFELEGWITHHLCFPHVSYIPRLSPPTDTQVRCITPRLSWFPYVDRYMFFLPRFLFELVRRINVRTVKGYIDFDDYNLVVLESGKALFLLPEIPPSLAICYRQSDSVKLALGKGRWYCQLEDDIFGRAKRIILKKPFFIDQVPEADRKKTVIIENGMALPETSGRPSPFPSGTHNAVYVGLHVLDEYTLKLLLQKLPRIEFHIVGPCLRSASRRRLRKYANYHEYLFLSKEEYMPMLEHGHLAIFPFVRTKAMKWFGLTSKFLHFMYFQLPIVSYPTGLPGEFDGLPVFFALSPEGFVSQVNDAIRKKPVDYNIDFGYYSSESRMAAYRNLVKELMEASSS